MKKIFYLSFVVFFLSSCIEDDSMTPNLDPGYAYFPVEIGSYIEYRADSIWHDQPNPQIEGIHDTSTYFLKEVIDSEIVDAQNEPALRIERFKRNNESDEWNLVDIWFAKRSTYNAEKVEENVRYVKLAFPITTTATWNLNALNVREEWICNYDSLFVPREYSGLSFPNTVKVMQRDNINFIDNELAYELYAEGVGLIKRYERDLTTRLDYVDEPTAANIKIGHEFTWEIMDYGVE